MPALILGCEQQAVGLNTLHDELLATVLGWANALDAEVFLLAVPIICRRWRRLCGTTITASVRLGWGTSRHWMRDRFRESSLVTDADIRALIKRFRRVHELEIFDLDGSSACAFNGTRICAGITSGKHAYTNACALSHLHACMCAHRYPRLRPAHQPVSDLLSARQVSRGLLRHQC